jgi:hypothetical protein
MRSKTIKTLFSIFVVSISIIVILFVVNRYFYSWTGLLFSKIDFCDYKSVSVLGNNGYPKPMSFRFEPQIIAQEMSKNSNYQVNNRYNGNGAVISRNFNGVIYKLYFENRGGSFEGFNLGTGIDDPRYDFPATGGEKCTAPSYLLRKNVFTMIDDLPLTPEQKEELKENVWVVPVSTLKLF